MTAMCDGSGSTSWAHDAAGRIITEKRIIQGSPALTTSYSYNLDSSIATVTYPSGKVITYTVSNAQRLTAAKDVTNNVQFATAASYAPPGGLSGVITGQISGFTGINECHSYNTSLEYTSTKATSNACSSQATGTTMDLGLQHNLSSGDNGTVTQITNNIDTGRTQSFAYDPLNRISSATTQATSGPDCWGQNFVPDALANLNTITSAQCSSYPLSVTVDGNNHITTSGFGYDAAGNTLQDGSGTGYSYSFDAENRLAKATGMTGGPYCYVYDGHGLRVAKKSGANSDCSGGTVQELYWRSVSGRTLAETDGSGSTTNAAYAEHVFFAGRRIASRTGTGAIFYYFADELGSTRTITTGSGSGQTPGQLCYDQDYTPYGQEVFTTSQMTRLQTTACPPNYKFTGYERDLETGLDYAFARYYSSRLGRFLSTDPLGGAIGDLQSHNAYAYVLNNPLNLVDPLGLREDMSGQCPQVSIDGVSVSGSWDGGCAFGRMLYAAILGMDAGVICPDGNCNLIQQGPDGNWQIYVYQNDPSLCANSIFICVGATGQWVPFNFTYLGTASGTLLGWTWTDWGVFGRTLVSGLFHGVRQSGQSFGACMEQNVRETTFGTVDPKALTNKALVAAESTALVAASIPARTLINPFSGQAATLNGIQVAAISLTSALGAGSLAGAAVRGVVQGGGYVLAVAGAATFGLAAGSAFNCR